MQMRVSAAGSIEAYLRPWPIPRQDHIYEANTKATKASRLRGNHSESWKGMDCPVHSFNAGSDYLLLFDRAWGRVYVEEMSGVVGRAHPTRLCGGPLLN